MKGSYFTNASDGYKKSVKKIIDIPWVNMLYPAIQYSEVVALRLSVPNVSYFSVSVSDVAFQLCRRVRVTCLLQYP